MASRCTERSVPQSATSARAVPHCDVPSAAVLPVSPHCSPSPSSLLCCTPGASPGLLRCPICVHQRTEPPWRCSSSTLGTEGTRRALPSCFGSAPFITLGTKPETLPGVLQHTQPCSGAEREPQPALGTAAWGGGGHGEGREQLLRFQVEKGSEPFSALWDLCSGPSAPSHSPHNSPAAANPKFWVAQAQGGKEGGRRGGGGGRPVQDAAVVPGVTHSLSLRAAERSERENKSS